jgi:hypothetical protein
VIATLIIVGYLFGGWFTVRVLNWIDGANRPREVPLAIVLVHLLWPVILAGAVGFLLYRLGSRWYKQETVNTWLNALYGFKD